MNNQDSKRDEFRLLVKDHVAIALGGAVGGHLGALIVAVWLLPSVYSSVNSVIDYSPCWGLGLSVGYLPGIVIRIVAGYRKGGLWFGFIVAFVSGAFLTAAVAKWLGDAAAC